MGPRTTGARFPYLDAVKETRREYSLRRLSELSQELEPVAPLLKDHRLCVYATGSYGRLEAWSGSDIDLFFLDDASDETKPFPFTGFIRVSARLIEATESMDFPPFSGDGKYLEVLSVSEMEAVLGSPRDDSLNAFTARMLLLLESQPLDYEELYETLLKRIIGFYYRDFADHEAEFVPVFLLNDILRFWRTLTLNYEHHRLKLRDLAGDELVAKKADSALKNYKLKVSRLATCFSMVANLSSATAPVELEAVFELCRMTPSERLDRLAAGGDRAGGIVAELTERYDRFLDLVQRDESELLREFADEDARKEALSDAAAYGDKIYELLVEVVQATAPERMRYLVI